MLTDLAGMVILLILMGIFTLLVAPIVMVLLWLNRRLLEQTRRNSRDELP